VLNVASAGYHRDFFVTDNGFIGLRPLDVSTKILRKTRELTGCDVAVPYGGRWPFLLRPKDGNYELVWRLLCLRDYAR
jgi:hypothetical protein